MQSGDIFRLDDDAIVDMENQEFSVIWKDKQKNEHRLEPGTQFRITRDGLSGLPVEVRASKINPDTGKCGRGRPRRFPASVVARLLGADLAAATASVTQPKPVPAQVTSPTQPSQNTPNSVSSNSDDADFVAQSEVSEPEVDAEEQAKIDAERKARVASLLGLVGSEDTNDDW